MKKPGSNPLLPRVAVIDEIVSETEDTFSLRLSAVDGSNFSYRPGQFNMVGVPGFGEAPFSFSSLDTGQNDFVHTIRKAGNVVGALAKLKKGGTLHFRGPYGTGWPLDKARGKNVIVVAGGIGVAPLRPVVRYLMANSSVFGKVFLLYGARTPSDMLYKAELKRWAKDVNVLLSADQLNGKGPLHVHEGLVTGLFDQLDVLLSDSITFTCGPQIMMRFVAAGLILDGQNARDIYVSLERRMRCGIGHCGHCQIGARYVCKDGPVFCLPDIQRFADTLL